MHVESFLFGLLVLSVTDSQSMGAANNCTDSDLRKCMEQLKILMNNQDLAFAEDESALNRTCVHLKKAMYCVNSFTHRCLNSSQRDIYNVLTRGAQQLMVDFCTPGTDFREQYLEHSSCYKTLSSEYKQCAQEYLTRQESPRKDELSTNDKLAHACCLFDQYRACTREVILEKCSREAADLGDEMVTKAGGPLVQTHCYKYKHNSTHCINLTSSVSSTPVSSYLLIAVSIILIVLMSLQKV